MTTEQATTVHECPLCGSPSDTEAPHQWCINAEQAWADHAPPFGTLDPETGDPRDTSLDVRRCTRCGGEKFRTFPGPSGKALRCVACAQRVRS